MKDKTKRTREYNDINKLCEAYKCIIALTRNCANANAVLYLKLELSDGALLKVTKNSYVRQFFKNYDFFPKGQQILVFFNESMLWLLKKITDFADNHNEIITCYIENSVKLSANLLTFIKTLSNVKLIKQLLINELENIVFKSNYVLTFPVKNMLCLFNKNERYFK